MRRIGTVGAAVAALVALGAPWSSSAAGVEGAPVVAGVAADDPSGTTTLSPDAGMGPGTASAPAREVQSPARAVTASGAQVSGFRTSGTRIFPLAVGSRPYEGQPVLPKAGMGTVDAQGVRMFHLAGQTQLWDHPAGQAQYSLANLDSYRQTHDQVYLDRAIANAQRLVDRRTEAGDAWFYPYPFNWSLRDTTCLAPWYSAIAQGQALSAFVRLYEVTHDEQWRTAADATFNALAQAPVAGSPFASWVDGAHHLWLEEYPQPDIVSSERVFNGHMFASFGVVDYWALTQDPRALQLFDGAVTTVLETALTEFRHPGGASSYSLRHHYPHASYHHTHVLQFRFLYELTHRGAFVADANTFRWDLPRTNPAGLAVMTRKVTRLYQVTKGAVTKVRRIPARRTHLVRVDGRVRAPHHGILIRLATGPHAGWYVSEHYGRTWMTQPTDVLTYAPRAVTVGFRPGTYVGYRYSSGGMRLATRTVSVKVRSAAASGRSAIIGGQTAFQFTSGTWAGYWVPLQAGMVFS